MKNGLEVDRGDGCTTLGRYGMPVNVHIKVVTAMLNGFHVNNIITAGRLGSTYIYASTHKISN